MHVFDYLRFSFKTREVRSHNKARYCARTFCRK